MWREDIPDNASPIGYRFLVEQLHIKAIPHYRWSFVSSGWTSHQVKNADVNLEIHLYPKSYRVKQDPLAQLTFALKHEGLNLFIIHETLTQLSKEAITAYICSSPTGKYARKIWFLYEFLLQDQLPIENIQRGSYIDLADPKLYYCGQPKRSPRHRVVDNLLGNPSFSPLVRRSSKLAQFEKQNFHKQIEATTSQHDPAILTRAIRYLYTKETLASWEIEREKPDRARTARFVALLGGAHTRDALSKQLLINLQKEIVDSRFQLEDYRTFQNYVAEEPVPGEMHVHFIPPKPEDLSSLMGGFIDCATRLFSSTIHPVVTAAILAFGFVFMHPFWDGNGRLHRFLIHYALSKLGFAPQGIVFPISAVMLRELGEYDKALESFSAPLMQQITDYSINARGEMTVNQSSINFYKFIDFTSVAEFLFSCIKRTIETDLEKELRFLAHYDAIKRAMKEIVDMPDQQIDLLIRCIRQNNGVLSARKRQAYFNMLTETEIGKMEALVRSEGES